MTEGVRKLGKESEEKDQEYKRIKENAEVLKREINEEKKANGDLQSKID